MEERLQVKRSSAGLGLFAATPFMKGETIIEYTGETISTAAADKKGGKYFFALNDDWVIDGSDRRNTARYINHSCKPNCYAELTADEEQIFIIAKRKIKAGEELTCDYGKEYIEIEIEPIGCKCAHCLEQ